MDLSGNNFRLYIYTMDPKIEKIKKIFTDARKLEVDFEKFVLNKKLSERVNCSLFDKKTLFEIAGLAKKISKLISKTLVLTI